MLRKRPPRFWQLSEDNEYAKFGFEHEETEEEFKNRSPNFPTQDADGELPLHSIDIDYITERLSEYQLGDKLAKRPFIDKVVWGDNVGAVRLNVGSVNDIVVDKLCTDLEGKPVWIAKKVLNLNRELYANKQETVIHELMDALEKVNDSPLDSPIRDYENFEKLVTTIAYRTGVVVNDPLFIEGITKLNDHRYLIVFGLRGGGQGSPDQNLVNEVLIDFSFDPVTGIIKMIEGNVESGHAKRQEWKLVPSDFQLYFMPSQSNDEIVSVMATIMKYF